MTGSSWIRQLRLPLLVAASASEWIPPQLQNLGSFLEVGTSIGNTSGASCCWDGANGAPSQSRGGSRYYFRVAASVRIYRAGNIPVVQADGRDGPPDFAKASSWPVPDEGPRRSSQSVGGPGRPLQSARPAVAPYPLRQANTQIQSGGRCASLRARLWHGTSSAPITPWRCALRRLRSPIH